jgi:fermentation-respiration switch protein FrsA (DUF1100 family)
MSRSFSARVSRSLAMFALGSLPLGLAAQQPAASAARFVGTWQGGLQTPVSILRLGLTVTQNADGTLHGVLTSVDQGNARIPTVLSLAGDSLVMNVAVASIHYAAVVTPAGDSLRGTFTQGALVTPLAMARVGALSVATPPARPQNPVPPFPYRTEDVRVASVPGVILAGTLAIPPGAGPFPAVVFVTGSGPQDRDETLLGHRPFLVIADYLARHGIASLRYDDRGTARSTGSFARGTSADFADDAQAAVGYLRGRPEIAHDHIGILGHSEGGLIAPMVAARDHDVAFIVMLAGPGLPGDSILVLQQEAIAIANGAPPALAALSAANNGRIFAAMRGATDSADAERRARAVLAQRLVGVPDAEAASVRHNFEMGLPQLLTPWMRMFLSYDPRPTLRRVTVPVLALNGTLDLQVPARDNIPEIEAALEAGGNRDYRVVAMPGLNHLFQTATTGSPNEYERITETVSPSVLELVTRWILEHSVAR